MGRRRGAKRRPKPPSLSAVGIEHVLFSGDGVSLGLDCKVARLFIAIKGLAHIEASNRWYFNDDLVAVVDDAWATTNVASHGFRVFSVLKDSAGDFLARSHEEGAPPSLYSIRNQSVA